MCLTQIPHPHSSRALQVTNGYVLSTTSQLYRLKVSYCDHRMPVVRQQFPLNNVSFYTTWWYSSIPLGGISPNYTEILLQST